MNKLLFRLSSYTLPEYIGFPFLLHVLQKIIDPFNVSAKAETRVRLPKLTYSLVIVYKGLPYSFLKFSFLPIVQIQLKFNKNLKYRDKLYNKYLIKV